MSHLTGPRLGRGVSQGDHACWPEKVTFRVALAFSSMMTGFWSRVCDRKTTTHTHTRVSHAQPNERESSRTEKLGFCLTQLLAVSFQASRSQVFSQETDGLEFILNDLGVWVFFFF